MDALINLEHVGNVYYAGLLLFIPVFFFVFSTTHQNILSDNSTLLYYIQILLISGMLSFIWPFLVAIFVSFVTIVLWKGENEINDKNIK